jgi:hypothetical protein
VFDVLHQVKVSCLVRCAPVANIDCRSTDIFKTNCVCLKGIIKSTSTGRLSCNFLILYIYIYIYISLVVVVVVVLTYYLEFALLCIFVVSVSQ